MTERLADVTERIRSIRQLGAVVNAMTGIAAARARTARGQLEAVDLYAGNIAAAMARMVEGGGPGPRDAGQGRGALLLFCAEQGFAGAFTERVLDAVADDTGDDLFLIGTRAAAVASQRGLAPRWTASMPSHSPSIPKFADRMLGTLSADLASGRIGRLDAVYTVWRKGAARVERRRLLPLDPADLPQVTGDAPLIQLDRAALLTALGGEYLHAQLCQAALHAFAAENEARMAAMSAARAQVERELAADQAVERRVRQEATTAEIIELASGEQASRGRR